MIFMEFDWVTFSVLLGLKQIHDITSKVPAELRIDLVDWDGNTAFASYDFFKVSGPDTKYRLAVTGYSGNAGMQYTLIF